MFAQNGGIIRIAVAPGPGAWRGFAAAFAGCPAEPLALTSPRGSRGAVSGGPGLYKAKWLLYRNMAVP